MMSYSDRKDHLTADELANFLGNEQKVRVLLVLLNFVTLDLGKMQLSVN